MSKYDSDEFSDFFNPDMKNTAYNDDSLQRNDDINTDNYQQNYDDLDEFDELDSDGNSSYDSDSSYNSRGADKGGHSKGRSSSSGSSRNKNKGKKGGKNRNNSSRSKSNRADGRNSEEDKMRKKIRRSKRVGTLLATLQLVASVAFMVLLFFARKNLAAIITIPVYAAIGAGLGVLYILALTLQFKRLLLKRIGKVISVIVIIVLAIASYFIYPLMGTKLGGTSKVSEAPFALFLSGNDSFGEISNKENGRSDTNILAIVNPKTYTALLVSTPRDAYVELLGDDIPRGNYDKLTHAGLFGTGKKDSDGNWEHGCTVSMNILSDLYDIKIDHYLRLNFTGFADLVDNLGGVTINIPQGFSTYTYGKSYTFNEGKQTLNGNEALTYVRERHSFAKGDIQRNANQVAVIKAMADKIISTNTIANYGKIVKNIGKSFETDLDISSLAALQLQLQGKEDYKGWNIVSYSVDGGTGGEYQYCYALDASASVVNLYDDSVNVAKTLIKKVMNGEKVTKKTVTKLSEQSDNTTGSSDNNQQ